MRPSHWTYWNNADLVFALLVALIAEVIALGFPEAYSPFRVIVGGALVLFVPGYVLMVALFPRHHDLNGAERLAVSLGLSAALVPMAGLILNYTPAGIRLESLTMALSLLAALGALAAYLRRARIPEEERFVFLKDPQLTRGALFGAVGIALIVGATYLTRPETRFTAFYLLGENERMENYPTHLRPGESFTVTVVVENREGQRMAYRIRAPFDPETPPIEVPPLPPGASWRQTLTLKAPSTLGVTPLVLELYRAGDVEAYREIHLFVSIRQEGAAPAPSLYLRGVYV
ncbi:protein of unknown function DUF1616 [Marinithermus hydrothermalis DSM 14884]|uniref:DUF1616 domain-containing protein n=1 Tax=Marinithermus hydrothermalis (strain DSM 14884 / JCM 11576 / T1) TaxID=869210 RepID=F2NKE6_MARHT|nr:protein of unknown function DUF1616 [Marinithermus hydrothermalis DSM 14884]